MYIDFSELKKSVRIEDVARDFDIELKGDGCQWRAQCPMCMGSERGLAINTREQSWYCHSEKQGGDVIALIAHTEGLRMKEAAEQIAQRSGFSSEKPKSEPKRQDQLNGELQSLSYLVYDHEAVPVDPDTAKALGIGFAPKGLMRSHLAIPIRLADGTLAGYIGIEPGTTLKTPKKWHGI